MTRILDDPAEAAELLARGGVVAVPTETVYGLAARFDDPQAVQRVFKAKGRPNDNPLIVHLGGVEWLDRVAERIPEQALELLRRFAPGPITVTVPRGQTVSDAVTGGLSTVAIRIPDQSLVQQVLGLLDVPLVAPSANRSGRPSPTTWQAVEEELSGLIDGILIGPPTRFGIESTVVDCCSDPPTLLRPGAVTLEQLREVLPDIQVYNATTSEKAPPSPGIRYKHYAPRCQVILFDSISDIEPNRRAALLSIDHHPRSSEFAWAEKFDDVAMYARLLFDAFRRADNQNLDKIYCQRVSLEGLGRGLMDRLTRAAE